MKIIKGDLIKLAKTGKFDVIVHGCNCFNTMGSGIALTIKKEFPEVYAADCITLKGDKTKLGTYTHAYVDYGPGDEDYFVVLNAYTQYGYGGSRDLFEYDYFSKLLDKFRNLDVAIRETRNIVPRWGFPLIGCGLAGGDKNRILAMIEEAMSANDVTIVEFEKD